MNDTVSFVPIGYVEANQKYKYQQPRQGEFAKNQGKIVLKSGFNFEQALSDLEGFDRIWVIFQFHQNSGWRAKVNPPVCPDGKKKGVFATRSPHRPNAIGMSCVELLSVNGCELTIANFDLLDGTPILDIKPYVSYCDSYPDASLGWLPETVPVENEILFSKAATAAAEWLLEQGGPDLFDLVSVQLTLDPLNKKRKRITVLDSGDVVLSFRTWRIQFRYDVEAALVTVLSICSGYSDVERNAPEDKYGDKELHRAFVRAN